MHPQGLSKKRERLNIKSLKHDEFQNKAEWQKFWGLLLQAATLPNTEWDQQDS